VVQAEDPVADLVVNSEEDHADPMVLANPKLIAEKGMVSVTVISKIGQ
jgi:hypothetical protein